MTDPVVERLDELIRATKSVGRDRWLDVEGVADLLGYSRDHTRQRIVVQPDFPCPSRPSGGHPRWLESEVHAWMDAQRQR